MLAGSCLPLYASDSDSSADVQPIVQSQFPELCKEVDFVFESLILKIGDDVSKVEHKEILLRAREELHALEHEFKECQAGSIKECLVRLDALLRSVACTFGKSGCWAPMTVEHRFVGIVTDAQEHLFLMYLTVADHVQQLKDAVSTMDFSFIRSLGSNIVDLARAAKLDLFAERSWYYALLGMYLLWIMPDEQAEKIMNVKVVGEEKDENGKVKQIKEYSGFIANLRNFIGAGTIKEKDTKMKIKMRKTGPVAETLSWTNGLFSVEKTGTIFGTVSVINICGPLIKRDVQEVYAWIKNKVAPQEEVKCPCNDTKVLSYQERTREVGNWARQLGLALSLDELNLIVSSTGQTTRTKLKQILSAAVTMAHQDGVAVNLDYIERAIDSVHRSITHSGYTGVERATFAYFLACLMVVSNELLPSYTIAKASLCNRGCVYYYENMIQPFSYGEYHKAACCGELASIKSCEFSHYNPSYDMIAQTKNRAFEHALKLALGGRNAEYVSPELRHQYYDATWNFVDQMYNETDAIIMNNTDKVEALAQALINRDCLSSSEIYAILA
jgi:hypothetical protein